MFKGNLAKALVRQAAPIPLHYDIIPKPPRRTAEKIFWILELMNTPTKPVSDWSCLQISGPDSRKFLQGQLTNDVDLVNSGQAGYFALCTPKGRAVSNFLLAPAPGNDEETLLFLLPSELAQTVLETLAKYIVFSKAELIHAEDLSVRCIESAEQALLQHYGIEAPDQKSWASSVSDYSVLVRCSANSGRCLLIENTENAEQFSEGLKFLSANDWQLADIRDGIGFVRAASSDEYIPQMLNMQLCNGISFTKGCYTGQEIVARAQYRGKIKRQMIRLALNSEICPAIGDEIQNTAGKTVGAVVSAAIAGKDGQGMPNCELLAVVSLKDDQELLLNQQPLQLLELPYKLDAESSEDSD